MRRRLFRASTSRLKTADAPLGQIDAVFKRGGCFPPFAPWQSVTGEWSIVPKTNAAPVALVGGDN
jgi:hypothetical protein